MNVRKILFLALLKQIASMLLVVSIAHVLKDFLEMVFLVTVRKYKARSTFGVRSPA